jgi:hypothetical protein
MYYVASAVHETMLQMRRDNYSFAQIARMLGLQYNTVRRRLDPEYRALGNKRTREAQAEREGRDPALSVARERDDPSCRPMPPEPKRCKPLLIDTPLMQRLNNDKLTLNQLILGDPPPGRSALDQLRKQKQEAAE